MSLVEKLGIHSLGLNVTDAGRPLYKKGGFVDIVPVVRREMPAAAASDRSPAMLPRNEDGSSLLDFDQQSLGFDRSQLLIYLRNESLCHVTLPTRKLLVSASAGLDDLLLRSGQS